MIERDARIFATAAHGAIDQRRKYTNEPYIVHPAAVVSILKEHGIADPEVLAAAWLHDVVEDTKVELYTIEALFGTNVAEMVRGLTNEPLSFGNRAARYQENCARLALSSGGVHSVKLADLIDNTSTIVHCDPKFAGVYLREKEGLLPKLGKGKPSLRAHAEAVLYRSYKELGIR